MSMWVCAALTLLKLGGPVAPSAVLQVLKTAFVAPEYA